MLLNDFVPTLSNFATYSSRPMSRIWDKLDPPLTGNPTVFDTFSQ
jgi:hypothetical protein